MSASFIGLKYVGLKHVSLEYVVVPNVAKFINYDENMQNAMRTTTTKIKQFSESYLWLKRSR